MKQDSERGDKVQNDCDEETRRLRLDPDENVACGASEEAISFRDAAPAIEFACWVIVVLAPFLRWVNGAAVTDDQFVIQATLVATAAIGAIGLRLYNWRSS
jgi:hypothetical protein